MRRIISTHAESNLITQKNAWRIWCRVKTRHIVRNHTAINQLRYSLQLMCQDAAMHAIKRSSSRVLCFKGFRVILNANWFSRRFQNREWSFQIAYKNWLQIRPCSRLAAPFCHSEIIISNMQTNFSLSAPHRHKNRGTPSGFPLNTSKQSIFGCEQKEVHRQSLSWMERFGNSGVSSVVGGRT